MDIQAKFENIVETLKNVSPNISLDEFKRKIKDKLGLPFKPEEIKLKVGRNYIEERNGKTPISKLNINRFVNVIYEKIPAVDILVFYCGYVETLENVNPNISLNEFKRKIIGKLCLNLKPEEIKLRVGRTLIQERDEYTPISKLNIVRSVHVYNNYRPAAGESI